MADGEARTGQFGNWIVHGTDGIRGPAFEVITPELAAAYAAAAAAALQADVVLVARDTRGSGEALAAAAREGASRAGADVIDAGVISTPAAGFLARHLTNPRGSDSLPHGRRTIAVVITASHNLDPDNGLKTIDQRGAKPTDDQTVLIERYVNEGLPAAIKSGRQLPVDTHALCAAYTDFILSTVDPDAARGLSIVLDTAHGAAYELAPKVLAALSPAALHVIGNQPDGTNSNRGCGATHPEAAAAIAADKNADLAITFDGDADRVVMTGPGGSLIDGDRLILLLALAEQAGGRLGAGTVVATIMSNMALGDRLQAAGIGFEATAVGDTAVSRRMQAIGATVGGEKSGHIVLRRYHETGDGLLAAVQVLQAMRDLGLKPADIGSDSFLKEYPQVLLKTDVPPARKFDIAGSAAVAQAVHQAEERLRSAGVRGRVNVRPSGTESVIRVMVEAESLADGSDSAGEIAVSIVQAVAAEAARTV